MAICGEIEANIKHYKTKDTSNSREGKRAIERDILRWFKQERDRNQQKGKAMQEVLTTGR